MTILRRMPLFARCVVVGCSLAVLAGTVLGFVLGLHHPRTLAFAVVEGAVLVGVPGSVLATVVAALIVAVHHELRLRRRS